MNSPSEDIAQIIADASLGTIGTDLFRGKQPPRTGLTITVYDTPGVAPFADIKLYEPGVQVRVRDADYSTAYDKMLEIVEALIVPTTREVNGTRYIGIWMAGDIESLGYDDNDRVSLFANFNTQRHEV